MALKAMPRHIKFLYARDLKKGKNESLGLPAEMATVEFPKEDPENPLNPAKYELIRVHYRPPESSLYYGGVFTLEFDFAPPEDFPDRCWPNYPCKVRCLTRIWHPNIDLNGEVCHSLVYLKGGAHPNGEFTNLCTLEMMIQGLLTLFNGSESYDDPLNNDCASQFFNEGEQSFQNKARQWVEQFAQAPITDSNVSMEPPEPAGIACPACTFLNPQGSTNCEMCGGSLQR